MPGNPVHQHIALVDVRGVTRKISLALLPRDEHVSIGDHVLIEMGYAMSKLTQAEADEAEAFLEGFGEIFEKPIPSSGPMETAR